MRYIEIRSGQERMYIDEEKLEAIIDNPNVHCVPGQDEEIAGISYYMGRIVVYYLFPAVSGTERRQYRCGTIFRGPAGYSGVLSETAGESEAVPEEAEQIIQGVWVKKSDQAESK